MAPEKDERSQDTSGITDLQYRQIVEDIRKQPHWRIEADRCAAFYDGNQLTVDEREEYARRGIEPVVINQVKPLINSLLGLEAKTRADWRVQADSDEQQDLCEAMSARLFEAERETEADMACSEAFAQQIKSGIGWVSVLRNADPFGYPYRVEDIDRSEMYWDWHARKRDLSDARYVMREKWYSTDTVCAYFPEHAAMIRAAASGWAPEYLELRHLDDMLARAYDTETASGWYDQDWRHTDTRMVCLRELWYRVPVSGKVITLPDGRTVEYDKKNPVHVLAVKEGFATVKAAVFTRLRVSLWVGPHKLQDEDYGSNKLPYVPFWGYREDRSRVPYGIVRDLIPLQKEINARRSKLQWLLASKRVMADSDALDQNYNDFSDLTEEVARPDAVIVTNPARRNANAISIDNDLSLAGQQFQVMHDAGDQMQKVAGLYNAMLGTTDGAKSGTAIQSLVDQGNGMQADILDNYRFARRQVGQRLLELIAQDMAGKEVTVMAGEEGRQKPVVLNRPVIDALTGIEYRENDVSKALFKVALADVPSTPTYRAQAMTMLAEVLKGLPPQLQAALVPYYLESTEIPKRREMADLARKVLGLGEDGQQPDPEKAQMGAALQQMQAQLQEAMAALQDKEADRALKQRDLDIKASKTEAEIAHLRADTQQTRAETAGKAMALTQPMQPNI
ncbi:hypothetical protein [Thauera aromatica]|uniref:portal protein n=1 Tax=Thauera aromatica TaxID=59405 RepID=UPI001FFD7FFA|nr:hypothetical protein [Thauera aromatica]MCK2097527.1 hypothetical protein [Thauera aromatica]